MNEKFRDELMPLLEELEGVSGVNAVLTTQKIVQLADLHQDDEMSIGWRQELFTAAHHAGSFEFELAAFDGILARYDRDPGDPTLLHWILWHYKWICEHIVEFPQVSRERIELLFADMQRRYDNEGLGLRPVFGYRCRIYAFMGHANAAAEDYERWQSSAEGDGDDCPACETHSRVAYLLETGDLPGALDAAKPITSGRERCSEVPATTNSILLMPLTEAGKRAEAQRLHAAVYRQVHAQDELLQYLPHHLVFTAIAGDRRKATAIFSKLAKGLESRNGWRRFLWFRAAAIAAERLAESAGGRMHLDLKQEGSPATGADGKFDLAELSQWFRRQAGDLADQFNRRNGTTRFSDLQAVGETWRTLR